MRESPAPRFAGRRLSAGFAQRTCKAAAYSKKICKGKKLQWSFCRTKQIPKFTKKTPEWSFQTGPSVTSGKYLQLRLFVKNKQWY